MRSALALVCKRLHSFSNLRIKTDDARLVVDAVNIVGCLLDDPCAPQKLATVELNTRLRHTIESDLVREHVRRLSVVERAEDVVVVRMSSDSHALCDRDASIASRCIWHIRVGLDVSSVRHIPVIAQLVDV